MIYRSLVRALITSVALAAGVVLAGCNSDEVSLATNAKANQPVPPKLIAAMTEKDMDLNSPILVRLFKEEAELEVWKQDRSGRFALLKTYPICRWSGDLGPKVREGDRQAPEGFYSISPAQMNANSAYYLSFNTGFPNAFDRALGRSGSELMVHGDCSSRGCYAMTDEQIAEIYALGRESFFGGQRAFQFQAYPFHMTPVNMAKHRNNPNMPFWRMIKEGNDHFEVTKQEPKVDFCEKKYVFDAVKAPDAKRDPVFEASGKCPAYVIPEEIADAVRQKQQDDDAEMARLVAKGTSVARLNTGIDGGMNKVFAAALPNGNTGLSDGGQGQGLSLVRERLPGTIPIAHVNPPHAPGHRPAGHRIGAAVDCSRAGHPAIHPGRFGRAEFVVGGRLLLEPRPQGRLRRQRRDHRKRSAAAAPRPPSRSRKPGRGAEARGRPRPSRPPPSRPLKPSVTDNPPAPAAAPPPVRDAVVAGAQPIVPANSFEQPFLGRCSKSALARNSAKQCSSRQRARLTRTAQLQNFQAVLLLRRSD